MGYYAAGGYYQAGGFSFKKLSKWVVKKAAGIASNPILSGALSFLPGGGMLTTGVNLLAGMNRSAVAAVATSNPGTPGANAYVAAGGGRRRRSRRRRRSW